MMDNVLLGDSIPASGVGSGPFDLIFIFFLLVELDCVTECVAQIGPRTLTCTLTNKAPTLTGGGEFKNVIYGGFDGFGSGVRMWGPKERLSPKICIGPTGKINCFHSLSDTLQRGPWEYSMN